MNGTGRFEEAKQKMEKVRTDMTMENRPLVVLRVNDILVTALRGTGDLEESEEVGRRNVEVSRELVGGVHPDTLRYMGNLARTLEARGVFGFETGVVVESVVVLGGEDGPVTKKGAWGLGGGFKVQF